MSRVPLRDRAGTVIAHALIDDDVAALVAPFRWSLNRKGYVRSQDKLLHRFVLGLPKGMPAQVDHVNLDKLDNRRHNLRLVTAEQNNQNRPSQRGASSPYRGVSWHKRDGRWQAIVVLQGTSHWLGLYDDELEAARVASEFRAEHMPFSTLDAQ